MPRPVPYLVLTALVSLTACCGAQQFRARPEPLADVLASDAALRGLAMLDTQHGWAVGDRGVILRTDDGGRRWLGQASGVDKPLTGVCFIDQRRGWAVGFDALPYSNQARGLVLHTEDGGYTWRQTPTPLLPALAGVRFFDERRGLVWGESTALAPSGMYHTRDAGAHWEAVHADDASRWSAAAFAGPRAGVVVGPRGRIATYEGGAVTPLLATGAATLNCVTLSRDGLGWIAGADGALLTTQDGGQRWRPVPAPSNSHYRGIAHNRSKVWLVGDAGGQVATSTDAGKNWRAQPTGAAAPLCAIQFVDSKHGWAVGELGTIVATTDGGNSWQVQRAGGRRCAAMVVCALPSDAPVELIAKLGAAEGYLTAAISVVSDPQRSQSQAQRFQQATIAAGAAYAHAIDGFAVARSQRDASVTALAGTLGADATDRMAQAIAQQMQMLKPTAVLVASPRGKAIGGLVESAVLQAAKQLASGADAPRRVLRVELDPSAATPGVATTDFQASLNTSLQQWSAAPRELLAERCVPSPERVGWTALAGVAPSSDRGDPLAGLVIDRDGIARRAYASPPTSALAALKTLAAKREQREALLAGAAGNGDWASEVLQLTGGLPPDAAARLLVELAADYWRLGHTQLAADTAYLQARRFPTHPLSVHTLDDLVRCYSSAESALAARNTSYLTAYEPPGQPGDEGEPLSLSARSQRALMLGDYLAKAAPHRHAEPRMRFMLAAAARQVEDRPAADALLAPLHTTATPAEWKQCVAAEEWLDTRDRSAPKPLLRGAVVDQRPMLDGRLEEPFWQAAQHVGLHAPRATEDAPPTARALVAYDQEFLYLAIECQKLAGAAYPVEQATRPRDADLRGYDRVTLRLDTNRDYTSAMQITLDCRGWTHDSCDGQPYWNPRYFVASQQTDDTWTVEVAAPIDELLSGPIDPGAAWAVSLERTAPGRLPHTWTGAAYEDGSPAAFGLLLFE